MSPYSSVPVSRALYSVEKGTFFIHQIFGKNKNCWCGQLVFKGFAGLIPNLLGNLAYLHYVIPITLAWQLQKYSQVLKMFFSVIKNKNPSDNSNKNTVLVLTRGIFDPWTANKFRSTYHSNVPSLHLILRHAVLGHVAAILELNTTVWARGCQADIKICFNSTITFIAAKNYETFETSWDCISQTLF